jgi:hypothetical protein
MIIRKVGKFKYLDSFVFTKPQQMHKVLVMKPTEKQDLITKT